MNTDSIWQSLPMPALLITADDRILHVNLAAETFLNASSKSVAGELVTQRIAVDDQLRHALQRCRANKSEVFLNDISFTFGERSTTTCTIQIAPLQDEPETLLMLIQPRACASSRKSPTSFDRASPWNSSSRS